MDKVNRLVSQDAVVIFSNSACCMCHSIKRLFCELGVNARVYELDEDASRGAEMEKALSRLLGRKSPLPVVFVGGRCVGSTNEVMSLHLSRDRALISMLRDAGALWL
ncbi:Glutaredoxin-C1 [Asimina triloba]